MIRQHFKRARSYLFIISKENNMLKIFENKKEYDQFHQKCKSKRFPPELQEKLQTDKVGLFNMWMKAGPEKFTKQIILSF